MYPLVHKSLHTTTSIYTYSFHLGWGGGIFYFSISINVSEYCFHWHWLNPGVRIHIRGKNWINWIKSEHFLCNTPVWGVLYNQAAVSPYPQPVTTHSLECFRCRSFCWVMDGHHLHNKFNRCLYIRFANHSSYSTVDQNWNVVKISVNIGTLNKRQFFEDMWSQPKPRNEQV